MRFLLLIIILSGYCFPQVERIFFDLNYTKTVSKNENPFLSFTIRPDILDYDFIEFTVKSEKSFNIDSNKILKFDKDTTLVFRKNNETTFNYAYTTRIEFDLVKQKIFQLLIELNPDYNSESYSYYYDIFIHKDGKTYDYKEFNRDYIDNKEDKIEIRNIKKSENFSTYSVSLSKKSKIEYIPKNDILDSLKFSFQIKFRNYKGNFFSILNEDLKDTLISLSLNKFGILVLNNNNSSNSILKDAYFLKNGWYDISLMINNVENKVEVINNNTIISELSLQELFFNGLKFVFVSSVKEGFLLDNLSIREYFSNKVNHSEEFTFDEPEKLNESIILKNTKFVKDLSKRIDFSPELNVYDYDYYYSIEWKEKFSEISDYFIIEKSTDGRTFFEISRKFAENSESQQSTMYYSDEKSVNNEIVYYRIKQINKDGTSIFSNLIKIGNNKISRFKINQNYPNPFNPNTNINVEIFETVEVEIIVFDIVGKEVGYLYKGTLSEGTHSFYFDGSDLPSGIYLCEIRSENEIQVQKMILTK